MIDANKYKTHKAWVESILAPLQQFTGLPFEQLSAGDIYLSNRGISELPSVFWEWCLLLKSVCINLDMNNISELPPIPDRCELEIESFSACFNKIKHVPVIKAMRIDLSFNPIETIDDGIFWKADGAFQCGFSIGLEELNLKCCGLKQVPLGIHGAKETLQELNLLGNNIEEIPDLAEFEKLMCVNLEDNPIPEERQKEMEAQYPKVFFELDYHRKNDGSTDCAE